jgi:Lrp/AsnC family leucine-responsive transcriptional regulator
MDKTDRLILDHLVDDARASIKNVAEKVGLSPPSVHQRLRKMEAAGIVRYAALVEPRAAGAPLVAFIAFGIGPGTTDMSPVDQALREEPAVLEAHEVAGEDCYLLKVRTDSPEGLADVLRRLREIDEQAQTRSTIVLRTVFERPLRPAREGDLETRDKQGSADRF